MFALGLSMPSRVEVLDSGKYKNMGILDPWKQSEYLAVKEWLIVYYRH